MCCSSRYFRAKCRADWAISDEIGRQGRQWRMRNRFSALSCRSATIHTHHSPIRGAPGDEAGEVGSRDGSHLLSQDVLKWESYSFSLNDPKFVTNGYDNFNGDCIISNYRYLWPTRKNTTSAVARILWIFNSAAVAEGCIHVTWVRAVNTHFESLVTYFTKCCVNKVLRHFLLLLFEKKRKKKNTQGNNHLVNTVTSKTGKENMFTQNKSLLI